MLIQRGYLTRNEEASIVICSAKPCFSPGQISLKKAEGGETKGKEIL